MSESSRGKRIIALGSWLDTPAGVYVRRWEQSRLNTLTADIFGFQALQIGLHEINGLEANRMPNRWLSDSCLPERQCELAVVHDFGELPFATQSIDLIVLPHVLEFADEPHQVLREVERVLIPEGQLIICGFNPASLWGARQAFGRLSGRRFLPRDGEFISVPRLKDWLKLLNMEVNRSHFGCYRPAFATEKWLKRFGFLEKAGERWWPYLGAVYMMQAIKRIKGMRLIGPAWDTRKAKAPSAVPAANRVNKSAHQSKS
jgi:SAM-dependent methyltransferase